MEKSIKKEIVIWIVMTLPLLCLAVLWDKLPDEVPIHFDLEGQPDNFGTKMSLLWICFLLPVGVYVLMSVIGKIDPKSNLHKMGSKFYTIKLFLVAFMSVICFFIISAAKTGYTDMRMLYGLLSFLLIFLGNYLPSVPPNYFFGIRTPWTLENKEVWKKTHRLGGKLMMGTGVVLLGLSFLLEAKLYFPFFISGVLISSIVPLVYSYVFYKKNVSY